MPKTSAQKSKDYRENLKAKGYKEIRRLWIRPEYEEALREYAKFLEREYEKCIDKL